MVNKQIQPTIVTDKPGVTDNPGAANDPNAVAEPSGLSDAATNAEATVAEPTRGTAFATGQPLSLARMLVQSSMLASEHVLKAQVTATKERSPLWRVLIREGHVLSRDIAAMFAMHLGLSMVNLRNRDIDRRAVAMVSEDVARKYTILPIERDAGQLLVALVDPTDLRVIDDLTTLVGTPIVPVISTPEDILEHIEISYRLTEMLGDDGSPEDLLTINPAATTDIRTASPGEVLNIMLTQALQDRASDIHIEPTENYLRIRYRIDGILHDVMKLSMDIHAALISRLKIMSGMNIAERRRPQDGQITAEVQGRKVDVRVAVSSTVTGEMAVLRLLDKRFTLLGLDQLGMNEANLERYRKLMHLPHGMIVICGPTGSGKSTTLYASCLSMDRVEKNVISLEDPVEYHIPDANQMQIQNEAGITFATQLRSILRLDPDVILVGEIRDQETAVIATQAALTGHLVLTSLHANDSVAALMRLKDLGVPPYLITSSLAGVVSQRMVRVICSSCQTMSSRPTHEQEAYFSEIGEREEKFLYGSGCNVCAHTGYRGRAGVFEILTITDTLRQLFLAEASRSEMMEQALKDGMTPVRRDGMLKVKDGITTPYEVMRVLFSLD